MPRLPPQELAFLGVFCRKLAERFPYAYNHLRSGEQKRSSLPGVLVECHRRVIRKVQSLKLYSECCGMSFDASGLRHR